MLPFHSPFKKQGVRSFCRAVPLSFSLVKLLKSSIRIYKVESTSRGLKDRGPLSAESKEYIFGFIYNGFLQSYRAFMFGNISECWYQSGKAPSSLNRLQRFVYNHKVSLVVTFWASDRVIVPLRLKASWEQRLALEKESSSGLCVCRTPLRCRKVGSSNFISTCFSKMLIGAAAQRACILKGSTLVASVHTHIHLHKTVNINVILAGRVIFKRLTCCGHTV